MWATTKSIREPEAILGESQVCIPTPVSLFGVNPMKRIPLTQGKFALVDDEDFKELSKYKWHVTRNRQILYAGMSVRNKTAQRHIRMHRFIMNAPEGQEIDHKDGDGLNNRKSNLRFCTHSQNAYNQKKRRGTSSQYKGVYFNKDHGKWHARISIEGKRKSLGYFDLEIEAGIAYADAAEDVYGEFARVGCTLTGRWDNP